MGKGGESDTSFARHNKAKSKVNSKSGCRTCKSVAFESIEFNPGLIYHSGYARSNAMKVAQHVPDVSLPDECVMVTGFGVAEETYTAIANVARLRVPRALRRGGLQASPSLLAAKRRNYISSGLVVGL